MGNDLLRRIKGLYTRGTTGLAEKELPDEKLIKLLHRIIERLKAEAGRSWLVRQVFGGLIESASPMLAAYFEAREREPGSSDRKPAQSTQSQEAKN